jgi:ACR3 family arsenite efflux pump ArsB
LTASVANDDRNGTGFFARSTDPGKIFDRYLSVWVFLCMVTGVLLGKLFPTLVKSASNLEFAGS